ncbi:MAG: hypothetical protein EA411_05735 [Saprospirales bacterium]|nr:MAG: hypothetical protein EA411_05735 [Saprospirales bacterium]
MCFYCLFFSIKFQVGLMIFTTIESRVNGNPGRLITNTDFRRIYLKGPGYLHSRQASKEKTQSNLLLPEISSQINNSCE